MPWCDDCSKFWNPSSVEADGKCPTCGRQLPAAASSGVAAAADPHKIDLKELAGEEKMPWHFKLLVVALVLYLGWRAFQGVEWLIGRFG
jgi:hypothetical protein